MSRIHDEILSALRNADSFLCLSDVFGFSVYQLGHELVNSIEDDGYVPYVLGEKKRYRTSPLATCLLYLWQAGLLPPTASEIIRNSLFQIRDAMPSHDSRALRKKNPEDIDAWCVAEGASVWSTGMALIALLESRVTPDPKQDEILLHGANWLVRQQDRKTGGWPFQKSSNSLPTIPMSAIAIRALCKATILPNINNHVRDEIFASLTSGFSFLRANLVNKAKMSYWEFDNKPSLTATIWATIAFKNDHHSRNSDIPIESILRFAISMIPNREEEWESECFVKEPVTMYSHQKNFYSFMPAIIPPLLELGVSPLHPKVVMVIKQLMHSGQDHWRIKEYHLKPCTFTHAMAIFTLVKWCVQIQKSLATGFFPLMKNKSKKQSCPIYNINPNRCSARFYRRISILSNAAMATFILFLSLEIPEINRAINIFFDLLKKLIQNSWVMTLFGGGVASLLASIIYSRFKEKNE